MNIRSDRGQATVLTLVFLVVLLGMAALVLDLGSWYRSDRATQSAADAAALAGAQALPTDPGSASALAMQYATKNGGGLSGSDITVTSGQTPNDTINVKLKRPSSGIFTKLFGVDTVTVGAKASARASLMGQAQYVAPIGVNVLHRSPERSEAELPVRAELCNRRGVLHGGAVMALGDTLGGMTASISLPDGGRTATIESKTNFFAAVQKGDTAHAVCMPLHRGRTSSPRL